MAKISVHGKLIICLLVVVVTSACTLNSGASVSSLTSNTSTVVVATTGTSSYITPAPSTTSSLPSATPRVAPTTNVFTESYSPADARADLTYLFTTLEQVHPNLYAFTARDAILQARTQVERELTTPMTRAELYRRFAPLTTMIGDGHTSIVPPSEGSLQQNGVFPLRLHVTAQRAYVVENATDEGIPLGSEVLAINGVSMHAILDRLHQFVSGEREAFRSTQIEQQFATLLWLVFEFPGPFTVEYLPPHSQKSSTRLVRATASYNIVQPYIEPYRYTTWSNMSVGVIKLAALQDEQAFAAFLHNTFARFKEVHIQDVVIDLRDNGGGSSNLGDMLLEYLTDKPFTQFERALVKVSEQIKQEYRAQGITGSPVLDAPVGSTITVLPQLLTPDVNPLRFHGNVYVLVGPKTFSSAVSLASAMKAYNIATLIGSETGGTAASFGDALSFTLPHSGLQFSVSTKRFELPSGEGSDRGVVPDYTAEQSVDAIVAGRDEVMNFTLEHIQAHRN